MKLSLLRSTAVLTAKASLVTFVCVLGGCGGFGGAEASESDTSQLATSRPAAGASSARRVDSCGESAGVDARNLPESNTVPSARLITDFSVVRTSGENDVAILASLWKAPESEAEGPSLLHTSSDDTITFSVGPHAVVCQQDADCRIPFVADGTYVVTFERANGERFRSETTIPKETWITSPAPNSFFEKSDAVEVSWTPTSSTGNYGLTLSTFLGDLDCETQGWIDWFADTQARIPAGYLSQCPGSFRERFSVFYTNLSRVPGVGGGSFKGYSMATLYYTYLDDVQRVNATAAPPMTQCELRQIVAASQSGAKVTEIRQR